MPRVPPPPTPTLLGPNVHRVFQNILKIISDCAPFYKKTSIPLCNSSGKLGLFSDTEFKCAGIDCQLLPPRKFSPVVNFPVDTGKTSMADMEQLISDSTSYSLLDTILHYALFLGAIFQLVCIFAVIFVPPRQDEKVSIFLLTSLNLCETFKWATERNRFNLPCMQACCLLRSNIPYNCH